MTKLLKLSENKSALSFKNKSVSKTEITLYGAIGESYFEDSVSANDFHKMMKEVPDTVTQIDLRINSPGGDVFDGITIYNRLKQHKAKITVYIDGMAASIASVIALAGDEVIMGEGSQFMIHNAFTFAMGNARELEDVVDRLIDIDEQILGIYARKTKVDRAELRQMVSATTWLDADESLEKGFATSKIEIGEEQRFAASFDLNKATWLGSKPSMKSKNDFIKEKINGLSKEIEDYLARK